MFSPRKFGAPDFKVGVSDRRIMTCTNLRRPHAHHPGVLLIYLFMCFYTYIYIYTYIHTYTEREKERERYFICIYKYTSVLLICLLL